MYQYGATIVFFELSDNFRSYSTIVQRRRRYVCLLQLREAKKTTAATAARRAAAAAKRPLLSFDSTPCYSIVVQHGTRLRRRTSACGVRGDRTCYCTSRCVQRAACEARRATADVAADSTWLSQGGRQAPQPWPLRAAWRAAWRRSVRRAACAAVCDGVCGTAVAR